MPFLKIVDSLSTDHNRSGYIQLTVSLHLFVFCLIFDLNTGLDIYKEYRYT